nr:hypothetical protein [Tanacetum cinerariifolium]
SSSKLARDQTSNPTSSTNPTPKGQIRRSSKQKVENSHFEENLTPVDTMTDNRTMAKMLRAPTEGCAEAIVVPPDNACWGESYPFGANIATDNACWGGCYPFGANIATNIGLAFRYEALVMRELNSVSDHHMHVSYKEWFMFAKRALDNIFSFIARKISYTEAIKVLEEVPLRAMCLRRKLNWKLI